MLSNAPPPKTLAEHLKRQRELERERMRISGLINKSINEQHNLRTCNCEGCKWYWMSTAVIKQGQLFELHPNIKHCISNQKQYFYVHHFLRHLNKVREGRGQPLWVAYGSNKGMTYREI